jgi:hypothetical protein
MRWLERTGPYALLATGPFIVATSPPGRPVEGVIGGIFALAMLLPLLDMTRIVGRARRGSLVDGMDRRRPWQVALTGTVLVLLLGLGAPTAAVPAVMALGLAATVALFVVDVRALVWLRRGLAAEARLRPRTAESPPVERTTAIYDFGVGTEEREELAPAVAMYRERERVVRLVRGSHAEAKRALARGIALDIALITLPLFPLGALAGLMFAP